MEHAFGGILVGGGALLALGIVLVLSLFWIVEMVDILRRQFPDPMIKILWLLLVFFTHTIGALIYYFVGKPQGRLSSY